MADPWAVVKEEPAAPPPDPWAVVSEQPTGGAASLAGATGSGPQPPGFFDKVGAGIADRWENTPTSFTEPSLLGIAKSTYEGARDLARLPGEVAAGPSAAPGTEEYEQQRRALEDKTTQVAADVANPLGTGGLLAGVGIGRTAAFRTTKPIARAAEKPAPTWEVVKEEPIAAPAAAVTPEPIPPATNAPLQITVRPQSLSGAATQTAPSGNAPLPPTPAQAEAAVLARIGEQPKAPMYNKTDAYTDFVDNLHPLKKLVEGASQGKPVDTILNPYEQFRLTRGVGGKSEHFLRHGTFDFETLQNTGKPFAEIMKPLEKNKEGFKAYALSKVALEREVQGLDTGIPLPEARTNIVNGAAKYEKPFQDLQKYQEDLLNYVKKSGMLSEDAVQAMRAATRDFVPLYRVMDDPRVGGGAGKGFTTRSPTYKMTGSDRQVLDPLESVIRNTHTFVTLAERNRAVSTFVQFAEAHPGVVPLKKVSNVRPTEVHGNEVQRVLDDMGVPSQMYGNPDSFNIFRRQNKSLAPDEIAVWKDGKREVYQTDPDIAKIVQGMDQETLSLWIRMASVPAKLLRAGVVLSPEYMLRNITRDQMNAFIQSKHGYQPVYDLMRGLWQVTKSNAKTKLGIGKGAEDYQNWLKGGGSQSALVAMDRDNAGRDIWKYGPDPSLLRRAANVAQKPIDVLRAISENLDNATRLGEFMRATKKDKSAAGIMRGAIASRDVTQDFQRIGAQMRAWNSITAFSNAQIQGLDREATNFLHNPKALPKIIASITVPSVLLWAANHGDPRYEKAANWEKDYFWFFLPSDPDKPAIKVTKPFTLGMMFGSLPERMLSAYFDEKPEWYNDFLKNLSGTIIPNMLPTAQVPGIESAGNRSMFLDRPLVAERLEKGVKTEQYTHYTPESMKLLGKGISKIPGMGDSNFTSPIRLENYMRQWTGTLGRYGMSGADKVLDAVGATNKPPAPTKTLADMPIIGAFISRYPSANMQPIQDFYRKHEALERVVTTMKNARRSGDADKADSYRDQLAARTTGVARQLAALNREIRNIHEDHEMTPDAKRDRIRAAYMEMLGKAEYGNRMIRDGEDAMKKRKYQGPD